MHNIFSDGAREMFFVIILILIIKNNFFFVNYQIEPVQKEYNYVLMRHFRVS